jgi:hypothetical protein
METGMSQQELKRVEVIALRRSGQISEAEAVASPGVAQKREVLRPLRGSSGLPVRLELRRFNQPRRKPMTNDRMALADLLEKGSDSDLLRQMIQFVAQRMIEMEVETLCGERGTGNAAPTAPTAATATANGCGRPGLGRST